MYTTNNSALVSVALKHPSTLACYACQPKVKPPNITGLTTHTHTIVDRALSALWWAKHTITLCGEEDERKAAATGKLEEHSERKQGQQQREEGKYEDRYTNSTRQAP